MTYSYTESEITVWASQLPARDEQVSNKVDRLGLFVMVYHPSDRLFDKFFNKLVSAT